MNNEQPGTAIPLVEEQVHVATAEVITDQVRVTTSVEDRDVLIEGDLERGALCIERVAVEREVSVAPEPQQHGDTLVVSVVEERLVVEKRLFVVEELRITRTSTTDHLAIPETLRTMRAVIEQVLASSTTGRENDG